MKKEIPKKIKNTRRKYLVSAIFITAGIVLFSAAVVYSFEKKYQRLIYPGVKIDGMQFGGKTQDEVASYFAQKSIPFQNIKINLVFEDKIATLSGSELSINYDSKLSALQAYSIGRSGNFLSDSYQKWRTVTSGINLTSVISLDSALIDETLENLGNNIDIKSEDALFKFENGKVTAFKISKEGRQVNREEVKKQINAYIYNMTKGSLLDYTPISIILPVETIYPKITTENSNNLGIKELIAQGNSKFLGSILGRIHNIQLSAARINGRIIPPGEIFSFNNALGDVSQATGFQPAYIIKDGRTVLGDGGGVCQVSTTLFRAILNAGLPITERYAHSYRVSYYEQDSPPGFDATVFAPSVDLKFKNDTQNYILIQAKTDTQNYTLKFELYGTNDGRKVEITKPLIYAQTSPPPDLFQDDPTLAKGVVKQVDWRAGGAKVSFDYKVVKDNDTTSKQTFYSNYSPWQAVFLRGTRE